MRDERDDPVGPSPTPAVSGAMGVAAAGQAVAAARLVSRVYRSASEPLRAGMLVCLLRPLGTLSLVAVASGAFARLLQPGGVAPDRVRVEELPRYSTEQIFELARFVHEVNPDTLEQLAALLTDGTMGVTALSASALVLLYRRLRAASAPSRARPGRRHASPAPRGG